eukprot:5588335-Prymnesium_polylepis.1
MLILASVGSSFVVVVTADPASRGAGDGGERDSSHALQTGPKRRGERVGEESGAVAISTASEAAAGITAL